VTAELAPRAHRFAERVCQWPLARVPLLDLWGMLDKADPASATDSRRRTILADLLKELSRVGLIKLPSPKSYDRTERPHLPKFVTVVRPAPASPVRQETVWHPELAWVPGARLIPSQLDQLVTINRWMFRERDELVVPLRERSLEIFGDEKALDQLLLTSLFAADRLSLHALRARRAVPRMLTRTVGDGDLVLVVENSDTFDSLVQTLRERPGRVGVVGWGAGTGFEASILSLEDLDRPVSAIRYFGDLDKVGLRIPANASELAVRSGLPPVLPAFELYDALLHVGRPQPGQPKLTGPATRHLVRWLEPIHRDRVSQLLDAGQRLAQEAVGLRYLLDHDDWQPR
jgi:hypothetical protein